MKTPTESFHLLSKPIEQIIDEVHERRIRVRFAFVAHP